MEFKLSIFTLYLSRIFLLSFSFFLASAGLAFDKKLFDSLIADINNDNYEKVETFLSEKKTELAKDPEYYVVLLNYIGKQGITQKMTIAKGEPGKDDFALYNKKTGEQAGFMGPRVFFDKEQIDDALKRTQSAMNYFPQRLDIHFGIVTIAQRTKNWKVVGEQIVEMLKISKQIDNKWTWGSINSMEGDPKEFLIENILPRINTLFNENKPVADQAMYDISQAMVKYYPEKIYGYSNLSVYHMVKNEYDIAETYINKALVIDPNDKVVLGNKGRLKELREQNNKTKP